MDTTQPLAPRPVKFIGHPTDTHAPKMYFGARITEMAAHPPKLSLMNYMGVKLPLPPERCSYLHYRNEDRSERQVFGNDKAGNCVEADILHTIGLINYNAGTPATFTDEQGLELYSGITGYNPADPSTDQGTIPQVALDWWLKNGVFGHHIAGWVAVNGHSMQEVRTAIWLFENCSYAVGLPDAWVAEQPGDWFTWGVDGQANPENGHFFLGAGYDDNAVIVDSWGLYGVVTNGATKSYATDRGGGQMFTVLTEESIDRAKQKAPSGFDFSQLQADLEKMRQQG